MPDNHDDKRDSDVPIPTLRRGVRGQVGTNSEHLMPLPLSLRQPTEESPSAVPEPISEPNESGPIITSAMAQRPRRARSGDVINHRYVVDGQIGRGGMGRVFKVHHQVLGKPFALKLLRPPIATNPRLREMFYREARLASALAHDNICSIVDFGQDARFGLFMVMELLQGSTIFDKLRADGASNPKVACDIMWHVAEAVRYIHSRSIIHADIKSENILLTSTPDRHRVVKLLDFGLARVDVSRNARSIEGTPEYLAPERISGQAASQASDIYALGILFSELLTGNMPFQGDPEEVFRMHLERPVPMPSEILGDALESRADELVARATAKNPADRHADVAGFMYELRTLMNMLGMETGRRRKQTRKGKSTSTSSERARSLNASRRTQGGAEVFLHAPIPMAAVDGGGKVRVANQSFLEFLGVAGDAAGIHLGDSGFIEVYPELLTDLDCVSKKRTPIKRILHLCERKDSTRSKRRSTRNDAGSQSKYSVVEVVVILTPGPSQAAVTAGDIHLMLHPLGRRKQSS